ncbi:hypothetical protein X975_14657, partial [Stegodyphus mimosarum]
MASHENLRTIPLTGNVSESEEDGEIEKETSKIEIIPTNEEDADSESSKEDRDDSLDIKPPQALLKSKNMSSRHDDKKRSKHSRKHESRRKDHHRSHDRNPRRESRTSWTSDSSRKGARDMDTRTVRYRDDPIREREVRKNIEIRDIPDIRDVRDIRAKKDSREPRDRSIELKIKDDRHFDRLEEKKMEWRKKRLLFIKRKREQDRGQMDRLSSNLPLWPHREDAQTTSRDLREKLREKERLQQEKERRLERFRSPPKDRGEITVESEEKKEKELHISPEPFLEEEPMDYKEDKEQEEEDEESDQPSDDKDDKDDTESESESSDSDTEGSSHNSKVDEEEDEEVAEEESSEEEVEEAKPDKAPVESLSKKGTSPVKQPVPDPAPKLPTYLP